jgi:transposase
MSRWPLFTRTPRQRRALVRVRDHHPRPYLRQKAAALLQRADGWSLRDVAAFGLLKPRARNTVARWRHRSRHRGLAGRRVAHERGRKPAFSPAGLTRAPARCRLPDRRRRAPRPTGLRRRRWTLTLLATAVLGLAGLSLSGRWRWLRRRGLVYRRSQEHRHAPDPDYARKRAAVAQARREAAASGGQVVRLSLDEFSYYRRPQPGPA